MEENTNQQRTPYLFSAKELDEETGLYYFGARYYDPRTSVWQTPDPILDKYLPSGDKEKDAKLPGMGGVFNGLNLGLYTYGHQNPLKVKDPDGRYAWVDDAVFAVGGAVVGLAVQAGADIVTGKMSRWQDYAAAGVGGAAGGWALLYTGPVGAGAASGAASNLTRQGLDVLTEGKEFSVGRLAFDTGIGAATGLIPGVRVPGVTAGRGSFNAIYKQMVTKFEQGQISTVSAKTAAKMFAGRAVNAALVPGTAAGVAAGVAADKLDLNPPAAPSPPPSQEPIFYAP